MLSTDALQGTYQHLNKFYWNYYCIFWN